MGRDALRELAQKHGHCEDAGCARGVAEVEAFIAKKSGLSPMMIEWCVGVDDWAAARVHRHGWAKSLVVSAMYLPCDPLRDL